MSVSATTASSIARSQPSRSSDVAQRLSFPYFSFLFSALFNLFFLLFTLTTATSLCILVYERVTATLEPGDQVLMGTIVASLMVDLVFFSVWLHNRATSAYSRMTYAAYFREKPASLLRLWGKSSHHRRLFFRWHGALRWMTALDVVAVLVCVMPVHVNAKPGALYDGSPLARPLDVYHQVLTVLATMLELIVVCECVLEVCRRSCGPNYPNVMVWHPETGTLSPIHPHQYHDALLQQQQQTTPPHATRGVSSFAPTNDHPVYAPPAYGHQDIEDAYTQPHMPQQYVQPAQQQHNPYSHQQRHMQTPMAFVQPSHQQSYARLQDEQLQVEGEEQVEGQPRRQRSKGDEKADDLAKPAPAAAEGEEDDEGGAEGQGGELGAATAPLVMMMSPALMDEDDNPAADVSRPRVMLRVRPSDADRAEVNNPRPQVLSPPRYAVVHMSSDV